MSQSPKTGPKGNKNRNLTKPPQRMESNPHSRSGDEDDEIESNPLGSKSGGVPSSINYTISESTPTLNFTPMPVLSGTSRTVTGQPSGAAPCILSTGTFGTNIAGNVLHARDSRLFGTTDCPQHGVGSAPSQPSAQLRDLIVNHRRTYAEVLRSSL